MSWFGFYKLLECEKSVAKDARHLNPRKKNGTIICDSFDHLKLGIPDNVFPPQSSSRIANI